MILRTGWVVLLVFLTAFSVCGCGKVTGTGAEAHGVSLNSQGFSEEPPLWAAAREGNLGNLQVLVASGADLNAVLLIPFHPDHGTTPLHLAASGGHLDLVGWILDNGGNVNQRGADFYEATALTRAAGSGQHEAVRLLLARGADPNLPTRTGHTALDATWLHTVGSRERRELTRRALVEAGGRESGLLKLDGVPDPDLWSALFRADAAGLARAIGNGADVNTVDPIRQFTPLMEAVGRGNMELVRGLLDNGSQVDAGWAVDKTSPLGYAAVLGEPELALLLLERGADRDKMDTLGRTPLARARARLTWEEQMEVSQLLLTHQRGFDLERVRAGRKRVEELLAR